MVITYNDWVESLGMNLDLFETKLDLFTHRMNKYIDKYPTTRRRKPKNG